MLASVRLFQNLKTLDNKTYTYIFTHAVPFLFILYKIIGQHCLSSTLNYFELF